MRGNNEKHSGKDDYAKEKLFVAMLCLISEGPLRIRLADAAIIPQSTYASALFKR